jgi:thiol-disulfide isomerase/thioredoxin
MRSDFRLLLLSCIIAVTTYAQNVQPPSLNIGDPAPSLRVRGWIKGSPVQRFEKGNVYVLEFWATWCKPCIAAMPHFSALTLEYKDRVTIVGVDIYEKKTTSLEKVKAFVDSMGHRMDYHVAAEDSNFMVVDWFDASGEQGIPKSFVVNAEGRLAWIGNPKGLDEVLPKIVNNDWDIRAALSKRNLDRHLEMLDDSLNYELNKYEGNIENDDLGKPDSALLAINEIIGNEPGLKYAPFIAAHTFSALLKTDSHKAYEYGKVVLVTTTYADPAWLIIWSDIDIYSHKLNLPAEIYLLGVEAYQRRIDAYPETAAPIFYYKMAEWYWLANEKSKAIDAAQKAVDELKRKRDFNKADMAAYESRLQQYKNMLLDDGSFPP